MEQLLDKIKLIIKDYIANAALTDVLIGRVVSVSPLIIRIDDNLELPAEFFTVDAPLPPIAVNQPIKLIRHAGGQKYTIVTKRWWK